MSIPEEIFGQPETRFVEAFGPLLASAVEQLKDELSLLALRYPEPLRDIDRIADSLVRQLPERLLAMTSPTLVLELHVARTLDLLAGDTPRERFESFCDRLCQPAVLKELLGEYPVLARQLQLRLDHWRRSSLELLRHLARDWNAIRATFCADRPPGSLTEVTTGLGDPHRGGRSVARLRFASGLELIYKPRSLAVDRHFQELLGWLDGKSSLPPFRPLRLLDRDDHGWSEVVTSEDCTRESMVRRFYARLGGQLALLYALGASDVHYENLIAAGEHPMLIDLEALFEPRRAEPGSGEAGNVASVGLLPHRSWTSDEHAGMDISGLGAIVGQRSSPRIPRWTSSGSDTMQLERVSLTLPDGSHQPRLAGDAVGVRRYRGALLAGFETLYGALLEHRAELLADTGPLQRFQGDEIRVILRPTRTYGLLLQEGWHPDVLRDGLDRDRHFDHLWAACVEHPGLEQVIPAELRSLHSGDIPRFTARADGHDLVAGPGDELPGFFAESGLEHARRRFAGLSKNDLERQKWVIRATLSTLPDASGATSWGSYRLPRKATPATPERLLDEAARVGDRLLDIAFDAGTWMGLRFSAPGYWSVEKLGLDLYGGLAGLTVFLAYLGELTGGPRYGDAARRTFEALRQAIADRPEELASIGAFSGWGGWIYSLTLLDSLWEEARLADEIDRAVASLPDRIDHDLHLDILSGSAGCLGALLACLRHRGDDPALRATAERCGERLLRAARPFGDGLGWESPASSGKALAGYAHGVAGIAWSLLELAALTGDERFRDTARRALDYERGLYCPELGTWRDLRDLGPAGTDAPEASSSWCTGAAGLGIGRLRSLPYLDDDASRHDLDRTISVTLRHGFGRNHCLCHGDLGNLDFLLLAARSYDPALATEVASRSAAIVASMEDHDWLSGVPSGIETPGLMTGLAGTGYGLLRLAAPGRVPSILALEAPPGRTTRTSG